MQMSQIPNKMGQWIGLTSHELLRLDVLEAVLRTEEDYTFEHMSAKEDKVQQILKLRQEHADKFYKGGKASWWNFAFKHDVDRSLARDLELKVKNALDDIKVSKKYSCSVQLLI